MGGVSILRVVELPLEDGVRQNGVLHVAPQPYDDDDDSNEESTGVTRADGTPTGDSPWTAAFSLSSSESSCVRLRWDRLACNGTMRVAQVVTGGVRGSSGRILPAAASRLRRPAQSLRSPRSTPAGVKQEVKRPERQTPQCLSNTRASDALLCQ